MARALAYNPDHALNAICPYFTMFPLEYPFKIIKKHKKEAPVIFDPFCGRGTSIYAARYNGLSAWGFDTSPIAVSIAKAKLAVASVGEIILLAKEIINEYSPLYVPQSEFFRAAYSKETLRDLCALREGLMRIEVETDASILLRATCLGCLHGPLNKTVENASYFSNQMPRTFSSKPAYSIKYWNKKGLKPPKVDVITVLVKKLSRIKELEGPSICKPDQIICTDSSSKEYYNDLPKKTSLVITSPPYYGMNTYVQDQWLRMWFLGGSEQIEYQNKNQLTHFGQEMFTSNLSKVWGNIHSLQSSKIDLYIRFGTVPSIKSDAKKIIKESLDIIGGWKLISVRNAKNASAGKRQANQMVKESAPDDEYDFHAVKV